jgi:uncharacterized membrane protein
MSRGVEILVAAFENEGAADAAYNANLPSDTLRKLGEQLTPGTAALVAIVDETLVTQAKEALSRLNAKVSTVGLDAETADRLKAIDPSGASDTPA